ncbi:hypothetical protein DPMN_165904 [Dreissena polymorpha]|uniref:Uncharacterized protein n=1 Tax=Dreissena polymorpha TaxID=45954 RepID=A0A9D4IV16_DREPO|nr:hypothetical protein DPMN_165904 [Dreissena polymorpha]
MALLQLNSRTCSTVTFRHLATPSAIRNADLVQKTTDQAHGSREHLSQEEA